MQSDIDCMEADPWVPYAVPTLPRAQPELNEGWQGEESQEGAGCTICGIRITDHRYDTLRKRVENHGGGHFKSHHACSNPILFNVK